MINHVDKILKETKKLALKSSTVKSGAQKHLLINGNSADILKSFPNESIDLIFTDPPYNADLEYGSTYKDNLSWDKYYEQAKKWFKEYNRILSKTGSIYLMNYPEVNARLLPYLTDELGLKLQRWITWHYPTNIGHSKKNFTRSQRSILFLTKTNKYVFNREKIIQPYKNENVGKIKERIKNGAKGRGAYDMLSFLDLLEMKIADKHFDALDVHDVNLLKNVSKDRLNGKHPCQLPFELIKRFIEVSSNPGDTILDPFAGTFSTSFVASNLKRNSIGIEINPKYVKLGSVRLNK
jgi:DNA modification methylase